MQTVGSVILEITFGSLGADQEGNVIQDFVMFMYVPKINYPKVILKIWPKCAKNITNLLRSD